MGIIFALVSCFFFRPAIPVCAMLLIPLVIDGFVQQLTSYESTNWRRFFTGILFGYGLCMLVVITTIAAFEAGVEMGFDYKNE